MYKICFYVTQEYLETVKNAMFKAGAGKIGDYACCAWQTLGQGQFMPLEGSQAFIGQMHQLEKLDEYKVEMVCAEHCIEEVVRAMREAHPYEEPAYQVFRIEDF